MAHKGRLYPILQRGRPLWNGDIEPYPHMMAKAYMWNPGRWLDGVDLDQGFGPFRLDWDQSIDWPFVQFISDGLTFGGQPVVVRFKWGYGDGTGSNVVNYWGFEVNGVEKFKFSDTRSAGAYSAPEAFAPGLWTTPTPMHPIPDQEMQCTPVSWADI